MTNDLIRRFAEHQRGHTKTTRSMKEISIVYQEAFITFEEARIRECYFKTAAGRRFLKTKQLCARSSVGYPPDRTTAVRSFGRGASGCVYSLRITRSNGSII